MWVGLDKSPCGMAPEDRTGQAYNEPAFRHFLAIERRRAARASRSILLLLVSLRRQPGRGVVISKGVASRLFAALTLCVREVDFIGWYREERVAGAVLTQGPGMPEPAATSRIGDRVTQILRNHLSALEAQQLEVRVVQLRRRTTE